jgi:hypothetical protein
MRQAGVKEFTNAQQEAKGAEENNSLRLQLEQESPIVWGFYLSFV